MDCEANSEVSLFLIYLFIFILFFSSFFLLFFFFSSFFLFFLFFSFSFFSFFYIFLVIFFNPLTNSLELKVHCVLLSTLNSFFFFFSLPFFLFSPFFLFFSFFFPVHCVLLSALTPLCLSVQELLCYLIDDGGFLIMSNQKEDWNRVRFPHRSTPPMGRS